MFGLIATLVALAAVVARSVAWPWMWAVVAASLCHYLLWAAPVGLAAALVARRTATVWVAALLSGVVLYAEVPMLVSNDIPPHGARVVVMQANLRLGETSASAVVALVQNFDVDVLSTVELTTSEQDRLLAAGLATLLPYRFTAPVDGSGRGIGLWSRYPLVATRQAAGFYLGALTARVAAPSAFTVVAAHVQSPYRVPVRYWAAQLHRLDRLMQAQPTSLPVIVAGDLNATEDNAQFRALLHGGYLDAADQAGAGYQATYPAGRWYPPLLAIDHVMTRDAVATNDSTVDLPGSDHRGLVVSVVLGSAP